MTDCEGSKTPLAAKRAEPALPFDLKLPIAEKPLLQLYIEFNFTTDILISFKFGRDLPKHPLSKVVPANF